MLTMSTESDAHMKRLPLACSEPGSTAAVDESEKASPDREKFAETVSQLREIEELMTKMASIDASEPKYMSLRHRIAAILFDAKADLDTLEYRRRAKEEKEAKKAAKIQEEKRVKLEKSESFQRGFQSFLDNVVIRHDTIQASTAHKKYSEHVTQLGFACADAKAFSEFILSLGIERKRTKAYFYYVGLSLKPISFPEHLHFTHAPKLFHEFFPDLDVHKARVLEAGSGLIGAVEEVLSSYCDRVDTDAITSVCDLVSIDEIKKVLLAIKPRVMEGKSELAVHYAAGIDRLWLIGDPSSIKSAAQLFACRYYTLYYFNQFLPPTARRAVGI